MAKDLEEFLRQAAERLANKVNQSSNPPKPPVRRTPQQSVRQAERAPIEAEIVEADLIDESGPNPLSDLDTRYRSRPVAPRTRSVSHGVDQADERMEGRLHQSLDHDMVQLRDASAALGGNSPNVAHSGSTSVTRRDRQVSPLVTMLRNPQTLRAAFIAGEIFRRPT